MWEVSKIEWFCEVHYRAEHTGFKPGCNHRKNSSKIFYGEDWTVLLLDQVSNSTLYGRSLQIWETLIKDQKNRDKNLFGKNFRPHVVETECFKKRTFEIFSCWNRSAPPHTQKRFRQALHQTSTNHMEEGDFTTVKNQTVVTHHGIWWQAK